MSKIQRIFIHYALPSIVGMLIVSMQIMIDGVFVSKGVGPLGLAAVNISMPLINVLLSVAIMIISGGVVICGIAKGENDEERSRGYTTLTLVVLFTTIGILSLLIMLNLKRVCYLLGSNDLVFPFVHDYLSIIIGAFFFFCIPNFTEAFTRLMGKPMWVLTSGIICCMMNVILDWLFVLTWNWGMTGAAIATCMANTIAALVLLRNVRFGKIQGGIVEIRKIFFNGSSELMTSVSSAITTFVFNLILMKNIGVHGVAALTIVFYLNSIVNMSIFGLSQALYPLMSYSLGARSYSGIKDLLKISMIVGGIIGIGVFMLVIIFKAPILRLYTNDNNELFTIAYQAITFVSLHYLLSFINIVGGSFHTAIEKPIESIIIAISRSILFVLIFLWVLPKFIGTIGIWLSMPLAELATICITVPLIIKSMNRLYLQLSYTPLRLDERLESED